MSYTQIVGIVAGLGSTLSFLPQVVRIMRTESVDGLSIHMMISQFLGTSLWTVYGVLTRDVIIISYNSLSAVLVLLIIYRYSILQFRLRSSS